MPWLVSVVRSNVSVDRLSAEIVEEGFGVFAPRIKKTYRRHGRRTFRTYALFPRYLFVLDLEDNWRSLLDLDDVVGLLMTEDRPAIVPQSAIDDVRERCDSLDCFIPPTHHRFKFGQRVRVKSGSFVGWTGLYEGTAGQREVALLELLGRAVRAEFKLGDLAAA